jgi:hypothetical protein
MTKETEFQRCVRIGYECGTPPGEIARLLGSTVNSVKVTAHKIGVSDRPVVANLKRRRRRGLA